MQDTVCADTLLFFFTVDDHTPLAGEHGEQEADMLEKRIPLGGEFEPEGLFRGQGGGGFRGQGTGDRGQGTGDRDQGSGNKGLRE